MIPNVVYVSATRGDWELEQADGSVVEQIIRPTVCSIRSSTSARR